jgi:hypothetical protein
MKTIQMVVAITLEMDDDVNPAFCGLDSKTFSLYSKDGDGISPLLYKWQEYETIDILDLTDPK